MSLKKQATLQNQITRQVNFCKTIPDNATMSLLQLHLDEVRKLYTEFEGNQDALEESWPMERMEESHAMRAQIEDYYYYCCSKLQECIGYLSDQKLKASSSGSFRVRM